ncbi:MAG: GerAB/ArcD/ProY family transporter [Clostridia bacterium]|nr:GerAB/ArcD/ProY family transporter [Clostridia bacterium]
MKTKAVMKTPKGFAKAKEGIAPEQKRHQKEERSAKTALNAQNEGKLSRKAATVCPKTGFSPQQKGLIAPRQLAFLYAAFLPISKTIFLPSLFAARAGHALLFPLILSLAMDFFTLVLVLSLAAHGEGFPSVLYRAFGRVGGKIVLAGLAAALLVQAFLPLGEERLFIQLALYETAPSLFYVAPLFLLAFFLLVKSPTVLGRAADLFLPLSIAAIGSLLLFAFPSAKMERLLPLFPQSGRAVLTTTLQGAAYFGEGLYPLFLLGKFSATKNEKRTVYGGFLIGAGLTVCFFAIFYAVFGAIAPEVQFGVPDLAKHNLTGLEIGRVDYFSTFLLLAVSCVGLLLPVYFAARCLQFFFGKREEEIEGAEAFLQEEQCRTLREEKREKGGDAASPKGNNGRIKRGLKFAKRWMARRRNLLVSAGVTLGLLLAIAVTKNDFAALSSAVRAWFFPVAIVFRIALPLTLLLFYKRREKRVSLRSVSQKEGAEGLRFFFKEREKSPSLKAKGEAKGQTSTLKKKKKRGSAAQ